MSSKLQNHSKEISDISQLNIIDILSEQGPIFEGELRCLLVYSSDCQPKLLQTLTGWLRDRGFVPHFLNEDFIKTSSCFDRLQSMISQSVLGLVILDGLQPFIPFILGLIKGSGKPVLVIHSANVRVNIKALYRSPEKSGLEAGIFKEQLNNPILNYGFLLPELSQSGINAISISNFELDRLPSLLAPVLTEVITEITATLIKVNTDWLLPNYDALEAVFQRIIQIYLFASGEHLAELKSLYDKLLSLFQQNGQTFPAVLASLIAATALRNIVAYEPSTETLTATGHFIGEVCEQALKSDQISSEVKARVLKIAGCSQLLLTKLSNSAEHCHAAVDLLTEAIHYINTAGVVENGVHLINLGLAYLKLAIHKDHALNCRKAIEVLNSVSKTSAMEDSPFQKRTLKKLLGYSHYSLSSIENTRHNLSQAINFLMDALQFESEEPCSDHPFINSVLGNCYYQIAAFEGQAFNFKQALLAFEAALADTPARKSLSKPLSVRVQMNIGDIYVQLTELNGKPYNYHQAIDAYEKAWDLIKNESEYNTEKFLILFGLGNAHQKLARTEHKSENLQKALGFYEEALKSRTLPQPRLNAVLYRRLGEIYYQLSGLDNKVENSQKAIAFYKEALKLYLKESLPVEYGATQNEMGLAYISLAESELKPENYHQAIQAFQNALSIYIKEQYPSEYIVTLNHLGDAYRKLAEMEGDTTHYQQAIQIYQKILETYPKHLQTEQYIAVQSVLCMINQRLAEKEKNPNYCKAAISSLEEILRFKPQTKYPVEYADYQQNLGMLFGFLANFENKAVNCKKAIDCLNKALTVQTFEAFPMQFATTHHLLGKVHTLLAEAEDKNANCKKALLNFENALRVRTAANFPLLYAETLLYQGISLILMAETEEKESNLKRAVNSLNESLKIITKDQNPEAYASGQRYLGDSHLKLAELEDKPVNLKLAIAAYREALQVYSLEKSPLDFALLQNSLGSAFTMLAAIEEEAENYKMAVEAYNAALMVKTVEQYPADFAMLQNNLGNIYQQLSKWEDKAGYLKKAYEAYELTTQVFSLKRLPSVYGVIQLNLQSLARELAEVEQDTQWYSKAFKAYDEALKVYTKEKYPEKYSTIKEEAKQLVLYLKERNLL